MKLYDIVYADPPWLYYGDPNKMGAAGKEYPCMSLSDLCELELPNQGDSYPVEDNCSDNAVIFMWATSPKLDEAIQLMKYWGFHYRGIAWVWVKTSKAGKILKGIGVRPSFTKPTTELLLVGSRARKGRPFALATEAMEQVVLAPRGRHSEKPEIFRQHIEDLFADKDLKKIELFARKKSDGWDVFGNDPALK